MGTRWGGPDRRRPEPLPLLATILMSCAWFIAGWLTATMLDDGPVVVVNGHYKCQEEGEQVFRDCKLVEP